MAQYNEILVGRFNRFVQKLFGMKGGPPVPQLSGDIQVSQPIFHGSENRYLESWNQWQVGILVPANVGNISQVRLTNDIGTNVIAVLEKVAVSVSIAQEVDIAQINFSALVAGHLPILTGAATFAQDSRQGSPQNPSPQASLQASFSNVSNVLATVVGRVQLLALTTLDLILTEEQEQPLLPQTQWQIQCTVANTAMLVWAQWRERVLEEGERT